MAIRSMTGYGIAESERAGIRVSVEAKSVNHRQFDLRLIMPDMPVSFEAQAAEFVRKKIARGSVTCRVQIDFEDARGLPRVNMNTNLAKSYVTLLRKSARQLGLRDDLSISVVAGMPGVIRPDSKRKTQAATQKMILECLKRALSALMEMRKKEGEFLTRDIRRRIKKLNDLIGQIEARAATAMERHRNRLLARIRSAGLDFNLDDPRVTRELVLFADRSDISEELTRLRSHLGQMLKKLSGSAPAGRELDFLIQEMNREINTIGSKTTDRRDSTDVVTLKSELERIREQAQNVE